MKIKRYYDFLNEAEEIKVSKETREFILTHMHDSFFQIKSKYFFKEFSVEPYKKEIIEKLKSMFYILVEAIEKDDIIKLYDGVIKAELIDYSYGNIFNSKFSLVNIPELSVQLTDDQKKNIQTSEKEFLLNDYSGLSKKTKGDILETLSERAQVLCCVIEALFYFIRTNDKENHYNGMTLTEILEEYEKIIHDSSKDVGFSYEGPFGDKKMSSSMSDDSEKCYWSCEKDLKKFVIFSTISIKELHSEDNVGGTKGLKFSLCLPDSNVDGSDYNYFNVDELSNRIELFFKKILK